MEIIKKILDCFFTFLPIGILFFDQSLIGPRTFTRALFGLGNDYNAEWWYIKQHMMMVLLFPLFDFVLCNLLFFINRKIIQKYNYGKQLVYSFVAFCGVFFVLFRNAPIFSYLISKLDDGTFVFTLVFFVGFLCAFFHLFEFGCNIVVFQKIKPYLAVLILIACFGIRWLRAYDAAYCKYDAFITAPIIYAIVTLFSYCKILSRPFQKLGKYSTYMWLTHTFFCYYYTNHLIMAARISTLMFLLTTALSLGAAFILTKLEHLATSRFHTLLKRS